MHQFLLWRVPVAGGESATNSPVFAPYLRKPNDLNWIYWQTWVASLCHTKPVIHSSAEKLERKTNIPAAQTEQIRQKADRISIGLLTEQHFAECCDEEEEAYTSLFLNGFLFALQPLRTRLQSSKAQRMKSRPHCCDYAAPQNLTKSQKFDRSLHSESSADLEHSIAHGPYVSGHYLILCQSISTFSSYGELLSLCLYSFWKSHDSLVHHHLRI